MKQKLLIFIVMFFLFCTTIVAEDTLFTSFNTNLASSDLLFDLSQIKVSDEFSFELYVTGSKKGNVNMYVDWKKENDIYKINSIGKKENELIQKGEILIETDGKPIKTTKYDNEKEITYIIHYNFSNKKAKITEEKKDGKSTTKTVSISDKTYDAEATMYIVGGIDFSNKEEHKFEIMTKSGDKYEAFVKYLKEETITIKAGVFHCYKLEMGPTGLLYLFAPKMHIWVDADTKIFIKSKMGNTTCELVNYDK